MLDKQEKHQRFLEFLTRYDLIDPPLHERGIKQAQLQQNLVNIFDYRLVFVSPHRRTIMTAITIFQSYFTVSERHHQSLRFILLPLAKEVLNNSNDLVMTYEELNDYTNKISIENPYITFDFSYFEEYKEPCYSTWLYQILTNQEKRLNLISKFKECPDAKKIGIQQIIENNGRCIETLDEIYDRSQLLKALLNKIILQEQERKQLASNEKILVVSHSRMMTSFFSEGFDMKRNQTINSRHYDNCEIVPYYNDIIRSETDSIIN
ncbi:UNKNOWN [Stylonychia lemnae]|uniref:Phosphoglycerate mutase family protein n=1 Tax=Stylonychia lemnae TaxID=5949 RepID=A0A078AWP6_STYLE|nr:UNKNOWN [Stylonychia lemnae]|eukprot:CDW86466.1 UNKNOWN [Stylonychia lemnae]